MSKSKIGIMGKGKVGSSLKKGLEKSGHEVRAVGNDPTEVAETAKWADLVILAVPFSAVGATINEMGKDTINGKIVIDATNVVPPDVVAALGQKSGAEDAQGKVPGAKVVKAFNIHFAQNMASGHVGKEQLTLLVAGDDKTAKDKVMELGRDIGFDSVDVGALQNARLLESLGRLSIQLAYAQGLGTAIGFKLVRP